MTSSAVHIRDMYEALQAGLLPGGFNTDRTVYSYPTVRSISSRGAELLWTVRVRLLGVDGPVPVEDAWLRQPAPQLAGFRGEIVTEALQKGGKIRKGGRPTYITSGKNLGRKNATNVITQALRDALGQYNRQLNKSAAPPSAARASIGSRPLPMMVKRMGDTRSATLSEAVFSQGVTLQRKFNGVRLVAYLDKDEWKRSAPGGSENLAESDDKKRVVLYSRTGSSYHGLANIREELRQLFAVSPQVPPALLAPLPGCPEARQPAQMPSRAVAAYRKPAVYLDGESYKHGKSLSWISGQARRQGQGQGQAGPATLEYHVFDCFFPVAKAAGHDMPSIHRQQYLDRLFDEAQRRGLLLRHVMRAKNFPIVAAQPGTSMERVRRLASGFVREGYEGAIARKDCAGYRYSVGGYHSSNLVKIKPLYDSEFTVTGYTQGLRGKDVGAVIWICEVDKEHVVDPQNKTFAVVPKEMTYRERYRVYRCLPEEVANAPEVVAKGGPERLSRFDRDFRGKPLTVEYPERSSKTGKPIQAKAVAFRTYEGPAAPGALSPLGRLYEECK